MGRPKLHESEAARKAAYRAKFQRLDLPVDPDLHAKLSEIAQAIDVPMTDLCVSMLKFALTNHQWARFGLTHKRTNQ